MGFFKRIESFFTQIILLLTVIWWYICCACLLAFGGGYFMFKYTIVVDMDDFPKMLLSEFTSYCFKRNPHYGKEEEETYFDGVSRDIYDSHGKKVGEYETGLGSWKTRKYTDNRVTIGVNNFVIFWYMLIYPFCRVGALIASFFAIFTNRFYVQVAAPKDYDDIKYNRPLHALFNIVWKSSERAQKAKKEKNEKKKTKQKNNKNNSEETAKNAFVFIIKLLAVALIAFLVYIIAKNNI